MAKSMAEGQAGYVQWGHPRESTNWRVEWRDQGVHWEALRARQRSVHQGSKEEPHSILLSRGVTLNKAAIY